MWDLPVPGNVCRRLSDIEPDRPVALPLAPPPSWAPRLSASPSNLGTRLALAKRWAVLPSSAQPRGGGASRPAAERGGGGGSRSRPGGGGEHPPGSYPEPPARPGSAPRAPQPSRSTCSARGRGTEGFPCPLSAHGAGGCPLGPEAASGWLPGGWAAEPPNQPQGIRRGLLPTWSLLYLPPSLPSLLHPFSCLPFSALHARVSLFLPIHQLWSPRPAPRAGPSPRLRAPSFTETP